MSIRLHLSRVAAAALIFLCLVITGFAATRAEAQPLDRQHACVLHKHAHERAACAARRARLARLLASKRGTGRSSHHRAAVPASGATSGTGLSSGFTATRSASTGTATGGSGATATAPVDGGSTTTLRETPVAEAPAPTPSAPFQTGVDSGANMTLDLQGSELLGAQLVRVEFPIATTPAEMEAVIGGYAAAGIRVLPLASFRGTLPTPAQAQGLAAWVRAYGPGGTFWALHAGGQEAIQSIELGNETSYGYQYGDGAGAASYRERAETYARRLEEAAAAIAATGLHVGLLAQADDWTGDWVNGMYAAVPTLSRYVAGWTIHPYHHWRSRLEDLLAQTAAHGDTTIPIDITEFGLPTDNGRCLEEDEEYNRCMSSGEAAATLRSTVAEVHQLLGARLGMLILYQVRDQAPTGTSAESEMYYGALQHELQPKGVYTTAVQELMAG